MINNWFIEYFYGKFTDFLLVIILILIIFSLFFIKSYKNINSIIVIKNNFFILYATAIIVFLIWFINFPTLRYAGYVITYLIFILPFCFICNKKLDLSKEENLRKIFIILIISYSIFIVKNVTRIYDEMSLEANAHHNFLNFPFFWIKEQNFKKIEVDGYSLNLTSGACWSIEPTCIRSTSNLRIKVKNNYVFYLNKNEAK